MLKRSIIFVTKEILTLKILILMLIFAAFSISEIGFGHRYQLTAVEFMIHVLTDHYYFIFIFPIFYLVCLIKLKKNKNIMMLVRNPRFWDYWKCENLSLFIFTLLLIVLHIVVVTIIAFINFPLNLTFTNVPVQEGASTLILYREMGNPLIVLFQLIGSQLVGLVYLGMVVRCLELYIDEKEIIIISLINIVATITAIRTQWDSYFPYISMNNYFLLHHIVYKGIWIEIFILMAVGFTLMMLIAKKGWGVKRYV